MWRIVLVSLLILGGAFGLFELAPLQRRPIEEARTLAANVFVMIETVYLFSCRSLQRSVWQVAWFSNPWLWAGSITMVLLQLGFTYLPAFNRVFQTAPITLSDWSLILVVALISLVAVVLEKRFRARDPA
ncbi:MAG: cation transporting ATPase C-terminal domain-containing protein [Azoarcus sp.]|nr:cation transporting ATPase C-terminal domain-containing protein [Azoarcus sp.]